MKTYICRWEFTEEMGFGGVEEWVLSAKICRAFKKEVSNKVLILLFFFFFASLTSKGI